MKPGFRIALRLLAPPFLGVVVASLLTAAWHLLHGGRLSFLLQQGHDYLIGLLYAYFFGLVPTALYAAIMEYAARRGFEPGKRAAILLSGGLGFAAGASVLLPFAASAWKASWDCLYLGAVGLTVGLLLEWIIGRLAPAPAQ